MVKMQLLMLLFSLTSLIITGVLIGVLMLQQVSGYIKVVKRHFIEGLISFLGVTMLLFVRRFVPLDETSTNLLLRVAFSLMIYAAATIGLAATILYKKPSTASWKEMYTETVKKTFLPFVSYMILLFILFILGWILPLTLELNAQARIYVPILEAPHLITFSLLFTAFLVYPTLVFLLASREAENKLVSRGMKTFAICIIGLAVSLLLQPIFLLSQFSEATDII